MRILSEFKSFVTERALLWLVPMVLFFGFIAWLAWKQQAAPASPTAYEVF